MHRKSLHQLRHRTRAFTVVEMIIVIITIAVLATLAFVSYRGVQHRAEVVSIMSDLKNLSEEMQLFYNENDRYPLVYPVVHSDPVVELEEILRKLYLYDDTRYPDYKKSFIFCEPTRVNPQRYAIIGREFGKNETGNTTILHFVTSDHAPSSTPIVWDDAITAADPNGMYASNACNTIGLKTGTSYFSKGTMRWSFDVPLVKS